MFGDIRTALAVAASIHEELDISRSDMADSELSRALAVRGVGVNQQHASCHIMKRPGPQSERQMTKASRRKIVVGSRSYKAYLENGLR